MRARAAGRTASVDVLAAPELLDVRLDGRRVQGVSIGDLGLRLQKSLERGLVVADRGVSAREAVIHGPRIAGGAGPRGIASAHRRAARVPRATSSSPSTWCCS